MDLATVIGLVVGIALTVAAIAQGASPGVFINTPSIIIVVGGTIATTFIKFPMSDVLRSFQVAKHAFTHKLKTPTELIREFVDLSQVARKEGLLALEQMEFKDPFMRKGVMYCVDGAEADTIEQILMMEVKFSRERHQIGEDIFRGMGESAPAFGMVGTLIGLVQMLTAMDDPKNIGPAMAVALLTTLYGSLIANLLCNPIADKLAHRSKQEAAMRMMMIEGILGLKKGENPRMLEETLQTFIAPKQREVKEELAA